MRSLGLLFVVFLSALTSAQTLSTAHDGIPDSWKTNGIDVTIDGAKQHLDLKSEGASVNHKDIFVWVAWMEDATHTHKPTDDAMSMIRAAFANAPVKNPDNTTGISLHILFAPKALQEQEILGTSNPVTDDYDWTEFNKIKQTAFPPELNGVFFFCIFAHLVDSAHHSGITKTIPGRDFIVSLGGTRTAVGTLHEQAGTFMHELGHALGLRHGGGEDLPGYKPDYISVMNYSFQFDGIPISGISGNMDYSRFELNAVETNLSETVGLSADPNLAKYGTYYFCEQDPTLAKSTESIVGETDWNCDGKFDASVSTDINADGTRTTLNGFNDWQHITLGSSPAAAGAIPHFTMKLTDEMTPEQADRLPVLPVTGVAVEMSGRAVKISWHRIPLRRVLGYQIFRRSESGGPPEEVGSTTERTFTDSNLAPGKYDYTVTAAFLPHSRVENEKHLSSLFSGLKLKIEALSEVYAEGGKTATYGEPVTDKQKIQDFGKRGMRVLPDQSLLLRTIPSRPIRIEVK
jgi:hypothetical protein